MKDNYRTIEGRLALLAPFTGNSLRGYMDENGRFAVWSYGTLIATAWQTAEGIAVTKFDQNKYSVTTSRHQNLIRRAWGLN